MTYFKSFKDYSGWLEGLFWRERAFWRRYKSKRSLPLVWQGFWGVRMEEEGNKRSLPLVWKDGGVRVQK